jgi:hypothetical protein
LERNLNKRKHRAFALEKTSNFGVTSFPAKTTANEASFAETGICSYLIQSAVNLPRIWCVRCGSGGAVKFLSNRFRKNLRPVRHLFELKG